MVPRREPALGDRRELDRVALREPFDSVAHRGLEQRGEPGLELFDLRLGPLLGRLAARAGDRGAFEGPGRQRVDRLPCRRRSGLEREEAAHLQQSTGRRPRSTRQLERGVDGKDLGRLIDEVSGRAAIGQHRAVDHQAHLAAAEERVGAEIGEDRSEIGGTPMTLDVRAVGLRQRLRDAMRGPFGEHRLTADQVDGA